jgi:hypothetical protein
MTLKDKLRKASLPVGTLLVCKGTTYLTSPTRRKKPELERANAFMVPPKTHLLVLKHIFHQDENTSYKSFYLKVLVLTGNQIGYLSYEDLPILKVTKVE